ncbi:hypothetical protein ACJJTC_005286 [Scirpophaga incertulas]
MMQWKVVWLFITLSVAAAISSVSISGGEILVSIDAAKDRRSPDVPQMTPVYSSPAQNKATIKNEYISSHQHTNDVKNHIERVMQNVVGKENTEEKPEKTEFIIKTHLGPVDGVSDDDRKIIKYFDIPYGKFKLFEAPTEPNKWNEVLNNPSHHIRCPQIVGNSYIGDANCLTLSVFIPKGAKNAGVLFYIHESNFKSGSGDPIVYGPEYLVQQGVILVLPNYRLGPLGFLCLQNSTAPGNAALKDLTLALQWTSKNIEKFGGNPSNIVVSGDGSSSAFAGYLALSSASTEYISKVILDSGSVLSNWAIDRHPVDTAIKLSETIRYSADSTQKFEDCVFVDIDIETLITASKHIQIKPCVENASGRDDFMSRTPWAVLNNETVNQTFIIGSPNHAGLLEAIQYEGQSLLELNNDFSTILPDDLVFDNDKVKRDTVQAIKEQYFGDNDITLNDLNKLSLYQTDALYAGPDIRLARALITAGATVYLYEFSFVGELNKQLQNVKPELRFGAMRGDLKGYLFIQGGVEITEDFEKESEVIELITNLWVSFIKTGKPTFEGVSWKHLNESLNGAEHWLSIDLEPTAKVGFHADRLDLWTEVYNEHFVDGNAAYNMKTSTYLHYFVVLCFVNFLNGFILKKE